VHPVCSYRSGTVRSGSRLRGSEFHAARGAEELPAKVRKATEEAKQKDAKIPEQGYEELEEISQERVNPSMQVPF
jgi:hypothetical protein